MDWRTVKFDWNHARAFLLTAEEGSLSAAARALGMAQPTLGRQVDALEQELGVTLFDRVGGRLVLTPSGLELLDHVKRMGEAARLVSLTASGQSQALDGPICITASEATAAFLLPPFIQRIRTLHPGIDIELIASNAATDLRRREADIALRNFRPTEPDLIAKKVTEVHAHFYATPEYLERIGNPTTPADVRRANFFGFDDSPTLMNGLNALGLELTKENFPIISGSHLVQWALTTAGVGVGMMMSNIGDAEPRVVRVLPDFAPIIVPFWLTAHREVNSSRRVRVVFDLLAEEMARW